jgi:hypothetical protein
MAGGQSTAKSPPACWNCGKVGHTFPTSTKPKNETHIANKHKIQACKDHNKGSGTPKNKVKNANKNQVMPRTLNGCHLPMQKITRALLMALCISGVLITSISMLICVPLRPLRRLSSIAPALVPPASSGPSGFTFQHLAPIDTGPNRAACCWVALSNTAHLFSDDALSSLSQSFE